MTPYRFLSPAEEEMTEAALFYESGSGGLGSDFLDDVQRAVERKGIVIVAVAHHGRVPGYWRSRVN